MNCRYDVIKETISVENKLRIVTYSDYEKLIDNLLRTGIDPDPETVKSFQTEAEAIAYENKLQPEIDFKPGAYPFGKSLYITTYSVIRVELDDDGDEIDSEYIGSSNGFDVKDVMNAILPDRFSLEVQGHYGSIETGLTLDQARAAAKENMQQDAEEEGEPLQYFIRDDWTYETYTI